MFKPQFEVGRSEVGKGGIVQSASAIEAALARFRDWCAANGYAIAGEAASEVTGADGNREVFVHMRPRKS